MAAATLVELEKQVRGLIASGMDQAAGDGYFTALARRIFELQFDQCPAYQAYCRQQGVTPAEVSDWRQIPAAPAGAFRDHQLACFPVTEAAAEFHTSGTTGAQPGRHFLRTTSLYEAAIRPNFATHLVPDRARLPLLVLTPSPQEAPHSSLSFMMGVVMKDFGAPGSSYYIRSDELAARELADDLTGWQRRGEPVFLLGSAFALVQFLDFCAEEALRWQLAPGSRLMETGGFKGRTREVRREDLYRSFEHRFNVPAARIVNEYGMTELSSQFYDRTIPEGRPTDRKAIPPWARVRIIDPQTGEETAAGEPGLIQILDLANVCSMVCLQTEDLGIADGSDFRVLGRAAGAAARGCSLTAEGLISV